MSGPEAWDEFELIARLFRPLAKDAPEALDLMDDAALIAPRPGCELVVTTDTLVEGVHFLAEDPLDLVARKALRVNLSDLAAKAAEPYGYFLNLAWPKGRGGHDLFAKGLALDQKTFGVRLFGGDTTATPGPLTISVTALGWVPTGGMVRRSGAKPGDSLYLSGPIGDGWLGLEAAGGGLADVSPLFRAYLADCYRLPKPRTDLCRQLGKTSSAADVSDGLIADAGHIAEASGVAIEIDLDRMPVSEAADAWLEKQPDQTPARAALAGGGDDYEIVCTASADPGEPFRRVGRVMEGRGVRVLAGERLVDVARSGFRHGKDG